jgi:hypothetical protein
MLGRATIGLLVLADAVFLTIAFQFETVHFKNGFFESCPLPLRQAVGGPALFFFKAAG